MAFRLTGRAILRAVDERTRVELPPGVGDDYEVYVNGVRQELGRDFDRIGDELVFRRRLAREGRLGAILAGDELPERPRRRSRRGWFRR